MKAGCNAYITGGGRVPNQFVRGIDMDDEITWIAQIPPPPSTYFVVYRGQTAQSNCLTTSCEYSTALCYEIRCYATANSVY